MNQFTSPLVAFGAWPTLLYFVFIVAATLRLDFVLPAFTGAVAAISYLGMACWVLSFGAVPANPHGM
jgi:adenylate cyclase